MAVTIGIDPHKASHTAVAIDADERILDTVRVSSSNAQVAELRTWACRFESPLWAIESANGLGYLLARQLIAVGETVVDVPPVMSSRTRLLASGRSQKNDPNDAYSIAVAALRHPGLRPVTRQDHVEVLKLMAKRHRDIGRLKNQAMSRLHALMADLAPGGVSSPMRLNTARTLALSIEATNTTVEHRRELALELIEDVERFESQIARSKKRLQAAVSATGTGLTSITGVGPVTAALIIGNTGDISRFPTAGHFASYNGTAPLEASSGNKRRHRLNPHGNRQLNYALHVVAVVQLRCGGEGRAYYDRKTAAGKSHKEALRALKRQLSDVVFRTLVAESRPPEPK